MDTFVKDWVFWEKGCIPVHFKAGEPVPVELAETAVKCGVVKEKQPTPKKAQKTKD